LNRPTLVSKIVIQHLSGRVSCNGKGGMSNFGCGNNLVALLLTQSKRQVLPSNNVHGYKKTAHRHSHWYTLSGVSKNSKTMTWRLKNTQMLKAGTYQLWYNEDLSNGTEGDNRGTAVYKVTITGSRPTPPKPSPPKPSPPKPSPCVGCEKEVATLKTHLKTSQTANTQLKTESAQKDKSMKTQADKFAKKEVNIHTVYNQKMQDMRAKAGLEVATLKTHLKTSQTANTQLKTESAQKDEMMKTQADKFAKKEVNIHADYKQEMQDMRAKAGFTIASIDKERSELKQQLEPQRRLVRRFVKVY
jgi:hypothetical protein